MDFDSVIGIKIEIDTIVEATMAITEITEIMETEEIEEEIPIRRRFIIIDKLSAV